MRRASTVSEPISPSRSSVPARVFSLVVTVRNDRDGLRQLLPALETQTLPPAELIIVDGGSVDGTLDVLEGWSPARFPVRVVAEPGSNIAEGRNAGVRLARYDWIACTDAGCRPDPAWLDALAGAPAEADVVGGIFIPEGGSDFERIASLTHYPVREELGESSFLLRAAHRLFGRDFRDSQAGGRSMAFRKRAWEAIGGMPADQYAGEDLAFTAALLKHGFRATLAPEAVIRWRPPGTWRATARMFFTYCRGDVRRPPRARHGLRAAAWLVGSKFAVSGRWRARAIVAMGFLAYVGLPLRRVRRAGIPVRHWWRVPVAVAVKDLSQLAGAAAGLTDLLRNQSQPNPHSARDHKRHDPNAVSRVRSAAQAPL
jgi:cellulose synthase/poly-beta-1,6-N-acetylglucosamine synthase-like glycosyltransferase